MDVISKEGPLFLQGVKFGKVRFIENYHLTLTSRWKLGGFNFIDYYFNSSTGTTIIFDALVFMHFILFILIIYFIQFIAQLAAREVSQAEVIS